jgi:transposase-like protein
MTTPSAFSSLHTARPTEACPYCGGQRIIRKGVRRNKYGDVQLFYCHYCQKKFTPLVTKHKSFPLRVILDALTLYNRLYTLEAAAAAVTEKYGIDVSRQNVRNWLDAFESYLPFLRLRPEVARRYEQRKLLLETRLYHGLVYDFKYHRAKTDLILERSGAGTPFRPLQTFLEHIPRQCPHALFREERPRASTYKGGFNLDGAMVTPRVNAAVRNARFVLQAVATNTLRHATLQDFMLVNDSVTVAVEVPIVLTAEDCTAFQEQGWQAPIILARGEGLTGHIDLVQIRYGLIHILDYKPGAKKVKPIEQLTIYALALSRLTGIPSITSSAPGLTTSIILISIRAPWCRREEGGDSEDFFTVTLCDNRQYGNICCMPDTQSSTGALFLGPYLGTPCRGAAGPAP